jgi:hypothetical protein
MPHQRSTRSKDELSIAEGQATAELAASSSTFHYLVERVPDLVKLWGRQPAEQPDEARDPDEEERGSRACLGHGVPLQPRHSATHRGRDAEGEQQQDHAALLLP